MNLYQINEEIMNCLDEETGEIIDENKLEELQIAFDEKVENIGCWIKNLLAEAEAIKQEKLKLADRQKAAENKATSLKNYLANALGGSKFNTPKVAISFRKSTSVAITSLIDIPNEYLKFKEPEVNKTELKKAILAGKEVKGAELIESQNIQIK